MVVTPCKKVGSRCIFENFMPFMDGTIIIVVFIGFQEISHIRGVTSIALVFFRTHSHNYACKASNMHLIFKRTRYHIIGLCDR